MSYQKLYWPKGAEKYLRDNYCRFTTKELAGQFGITYNQVKRKVMEMGLRKIADETKWSKGAITYLVNNYKNTRTDILAEAFKITIWQVYRKAHQLGLIKSEAFNGSVQNGRLNNLTESGKRYRFPKGHIPANKGKKMTPELYERARQTMFKPGQVPQNTLIDGMIVTRHNHKERDSKPYKWIRISKMNWEMLHVYNWKQVNGPVPKGMIIVFKNGDTLNCEVDNLELITRRENMHRNTIHRYPNEIKQVIRTLEKLNKTIRNHEQQQSAGTA